MRKVADAAGVSDGAAGAFDELDGRITDLSRRARSAGGPTLSVVRVSAGALYAVVSDVWCKRIATAAGFAEPPDFDPKPSEIAHGVAAEVSPEEIGRIDADLLLLAFDPGEDRRQLEKNPLYRRLDVVRSGRVLEIDSGALTFASIVTANIMVDDLNTALGKLA